MTEEERKFANLLHYAVKGHLINPNYSDDEVRKIADSYLKRLWGNHERLTYCSEEFEKAWNERVTKMLQSDDK